ncbi:MAG: glycerol-3-phosphate dehydrogenase, partial [Granulosicoccus sp.]
HLVVPKFWEGENAYLVQNTDKRVIFINPYEEGKALIGTTDIPYEGDPGDVSIDDSEIEYLLAAVNRYFTKSLQHSDILQAFSGVRPLYDDSSDNPSAVTRDYLFDLDAPNGGAPLLSVFGGKITTFRKLSEHALDKLITYFPGSGSAWTAKATLPGGDMPDADFDQFLQRLKQDFSTVDAQLLNHYARLYGTRSCELLDGVSHMDDLGTQFGPQLFEREVRFLIEEEWAESAEDILTRRTKHIIHMSEMEIADFERWFDCHYGPSPGIKQAS